MMEILKRKEIGWKTEPIGKSEYELDFNEEKRSNISCWEVRGT